MDFKDFTGLDHNSAAFDASGLDVGDLRRGYDFARGKLRMDVLNERIDPFLTILRRKKKKYYVTDSEFTYPVKRSSLVRRYGYIVAHGTTSAVTTADATVVLASVAKNKIYYFKIGTDFKTDGLIGNKYGQSNDDIEVGDAGTKPAFYIPGQVISINMCTALTSPKPLDYMSGRILEVTDVSNTHVIVKVIVTRVSTKAELCSFYNATTPLTATYSYRKDFGSDALEWKKVYVTGNAQARGSGIPEWTIASPYSREMGRTQIFKHAVGTDGTTASTEFNFESDVLSSHFRDMIKLHKYEIASTMFFGVQSLDSDGISYTEGIIDYGLSYGHQFTFTTGSSGSNKDDILHNLSTLYDPILDTARDTVHFCAKDVWMFLNELGGFLKANSNVDTSTFRVAASEFSVAWRGIWHRMNLEAAVIDTAAGKMMVVHDPHLDNSPVRIASVNMAVTDFVPLNGNGKNRDTRIYPKVQAIDKNGRDMTIHLIQTEAGMKYGLPETYAIWK